ncbi:hypothetical protein Cal6303_4447 [Calothrix sp. PCC 6303]|nr:hypothetical protein Cal6303_4447 [Calothrix sp. PCC 6303]
MLEIVSSNHSPILTIILIIYLGFNTGNKVMSSNIVINDAFYLIQLRP